MAIKEWSQGYPIEIDRLDVKRKAAKFLVEIGLIADVPQSFGEQVIAPSEMLPDYLRRDELLDAIEQILGPDAVVTGRVQVRYASQWDLKTRKSKGLPAPIIDDG